MSSFRRCLFALSLAALPPACDAGDHDAVPTRSTSPALGLQGLDPGAGSGLPEEHVTVRDRNGSLLFTLSTTQHFQDPSAPDLPAELTAPHAIEVNITFSDGLTVPVRFERVPEGGYTLTAFDDPPRFMEAPPYEWTETSLQHFTIGTLGFALQRPNWLRAAALAHTFDAETIMGIYSKHTMTLLDYAIIQAQEPWNEGWSQHCYDADFECSDVGDLVIPEGITLDWFGSSWDIDWRDCCLRHDVDFFCGGDQNAFFAANLRLANCVSNTIVQSDAPWIIEGPAAGWWWLVFYTGTNVGNLLTNIPGWPAPDVPGWRGELFERRQRSCLCGGDEPTPICGEPCEVNDCSAPAPQRLRRAAWEDACVPTCEWACLQTSTEGTWFTRITTYREDGTRVGSITTACDPGEPEPPPEDCGPH
jgi:hypothetical protein